MRDSPIASSLLDLRLETSLASLARPFGLTARHRRPVLTAEALSGSSPPSVNNL
jgi:hypothetical protein